MKLSFIIHLLLGSIVFTTNGQSYVQAKLVEFGTDKSIQFASIRIGNSASGCVSDEEGNFGLKIESDFYKEQLVISCIGYANREISIDSLISHPSKEYSIYLKPASLLLDEVNVKGIKITTPSDLLKQSVAVIPNNYSQIPINLDFYSTIEVADDANVYYAIETEVLTYNKGFHSGNKSHSIVTQKRENGKSPLPPLQYKNPDRSYFPYWASVEISYIDQLGVADSKTFAVFNPSNMKKFSFAYVGASVFDNDTLMVVEYSDKKQNVDSTGVLNGDFNGLIFIAPGDLAIVRHSLKVGNNHIDIIYKKMDNFYQPYSIRTERGYGKYKIRNSIFLQNVLLSNVKAIDVTQEITHRFHEDIEYNEDFWSQNYPARPTIGQLKK